MKKESMKDLKKRAKTFQVKEMFQKEDTTLATVAAAVVLRVQKEKYHQKEKGRDQEKGTSQ